MNDYDIWLVCAGRGSLVCDGVEHRLAGGDSFIFKPGARIAGTHLPDHPLQVIACHFDIVRTSIKELTSVSNRFLYRRLSKPEITAGLLRFAIQNAQGKRQAAADYWLSAAVMSFFEQQSGEQASAPAVTHELDRLCAEIAGNPGRNWTIAEIAKKLRYSGDHCRRLFLKHKGQPPMDYVIRCRIERACFLLKYTDMPVAEIADELSYKTIYYFSRQFRKVAGVPPRVYRRK
ncbi:MAG: hypothetical protein A2X48_01820 [Lentisphaerae bacterium GWF2_49_21]|nr:MAG: hypothetical protein A2X48_01820 [Lentisphaerae bacterium GWF2_49_21]